MGIYTRPDSPWWWMWLEGTKLRESTGIPRHGGSPEQNKELRRQAQAVYATRQADVARNGAGLPTAKPVISFADFADWYADHIAAHHRGASKERSMLTRLCNWFDRYASIADIDADGVREWMTARKRTVAPATVNRELDVLKLVLAAAVPKYLDKSPIAGLRRFRIDETEPRVLTHDEERRLLVAAGPEDQAWLIMAIDTLLRLSNVVNLKWAQVKRAQKVIIPLNAKVSHDAVPITDRLEKALARLQPSNEWVFPSFHRRDKGTAAKNRAIRQFDALCQRAGVPHGRQAHGVTFHCLRHTGATRALQNGYSVRTVMKLGGWKDERSVMRYVHAADSDVRAAAESISARPPHSRKRKTG